MATAVIHLHISTALKYKVHPVSRFCILILFSNKKRTRVLWRNGWFQGWGETNRRLYKRKEVLKKQKDGGTSKGRRSQLKAYPMSKTRTIWGKIILTRVTNKERNIDRINLVVLDQNWRKSGLWLDDRERGKQWEGEIDRYYRCVCVCACVWSVPKPSHINIHGRQNNCPSKIPTS